MERIHDAGKRIEQYKARLIFCDNDTARIQYTTAKPIQNKELRELIQSIRYYYGLPAKEYDIEMVHIPLYIHKLITLAGIAMMFLFVASFFYFLATR